MGPVLAMSLGSLALALAAIAIGVVVHLAGLGRIAPAGPIGLPGRRLRADATAYARSHRAATPLTWLATSVAAVAALGSLVAGLQAGVEEWAVLAVLAAIVLVVGLALATWRAHASLPDADGAR
ncbi:hypothetical protein [Agrococcus sediminis]|uniref:hypothetical protein n=1 Tax=Agrococcus sediminis TaxID=2599924 RepID=UPI0034200078